jgi:hypothetical protein
VLHLYKLFLFLYPWAYRQEFAEEMLSVLRQVHRDCASLGFKARIRFSLRETAGLLAGAFREQMKVRKRILRGGAMSRFRFPRWTIVLLVLALLVVLAGIETARAISWQRLSTGADISPRWAFFLPDFDFVFAMVAMMCVLGLIGYVVRVVGAGRNGIRRLSDLKTWPVRDLGKS